MESQDTLVTFLLPSIHGAGSVDLYGSWDNFSTAYPMQKDRQKGHGHWYGCHAFKNVICHGDPSNCQMPQDGPLKMGATYWYYYRRDGNQEFHDPSEASTNSCPLLPGQTVNVIELPILEHSAFSQPGCKTMLTVSPEDRWTTPKHTATLRKPTVPEPSRDWWFSQSFGRLHTAVVEQVISRRLNTAPDVRPASPRDSLAGRSSKAPPGKLMQGSINRPKLPWRNSNRNVNRPHSSVVSPQFQNPFQHAPNQDADQGSDHDHDHVNDFEGDWEYDVDAIADDSASDRPVTWACSFPTLRRPLEQRPSSMPHLTAEQSGAGQRLESPHADQNSSHFPSEEAPQLERPERPSIEPLSLPGALHLPLFDDSLAFSDAVPAVKQPVDGTLFSASALWTPAASPPGDNAHSYMDSALPKHSTIGAPLSPPSVPSLVAPTEATSPLLLDDVSAPAAPPSPTRAPKLRASPSRVRDMIASFEKRAP